jgi:UDP-2,3-diacylglucosamine hydrolase
MAGGGEAGGDLVYIGDVHLDRNDPALDAFLALLDSLATTASRIVLVGDLFNLWIGRRELEQDHQRAVLDRFESLRRRGVAIRYLEGNRDYRIAGAYRGRFLDESTEDGLSEEIGGRRIFAIHGDLANPRDRQYRAWRRLSRSLPVWLFFNLLPRGRRMAFAESLEGKLRSSNLEYKQAFPEAEVRAYAAGILTGGYDTVVLGHFHVEKDLRTAPPSPAGRILVLPEWKESRRHLRFTPDGEGSFVTFEGERGV